MYITYSINLFNSSNHSKTKQKQNINQSNSETISFRGNGNTIDEFIKCDVKTKVTKHCPWLVPDYKIDIDFSTTNTKEIWRRLLRLFHPDHSKHNKDFSMLDKKRSEEFMKALSNIGKNNPFELKTLVNDWNNGKKPSFFKNS